MFDVTGNEGNVSKELLASKENESGSKMKVSWTAEVPENRHKDGDDEEKDVRRRDNASQLTSSTSSASVDSMGCHVDVDTSSSRGGRRCDSNDSLESNFACDRSDSFNRMSSIEEEEFMNNFILHKQGSTNSRDREETLDPVVVAELHNSQAQRHRDTSSADGKRVRNRVALCSSATSADDPCVLGDLCGDEMFKSSASQCSTDSEVTRRNIRRVGITLKSIINPEEVYDLEKSTKMQDWMRSIYHLDPRWQIMKFFNDVAQEGVEELETRGCIRKSINVKTPPILRAFSRAGVFSVWRPTSSDAIRKMITGEGTGKGLDMKGKSARKGKFSGFVPFLQIHNNKDKAKVGSMHADKRVRVFYPNASSRDTAHNLLRILSKVMVEKAHKAKELVEEADEEEARLFDDLSTSLTSTLSFSTHSTQSTASTFRKTVRNRLTMSPVDAKQYETALNECGRWSMLDPRIHLINDYINTQGVYGLDLPERLFWEGYVMNNDITRAGEFETGRPSMPEFQDMNMEALRKWKGNTQTKKPQSEPDNSTHFFDDDEELPPRPVLWHAGCGRIGEDPSSDSDPMCPLSLLMAYEECDKVTPVVSDFDCFLLGTRGVKYYKPLADNEVEMLTWCVDQIEGILENPKDGSNWTKRWLEVKKKHAFDKKFHREIPKFGYADPRSYAIMAGAVERLKSNGAVRHGPECFNYGFPQELDPEYLVISDTLPGKVPWVYVNAEQLIKMLCAKVDEGFTFPLNPKWILCDPGWKTVYDKLLCSDRANVQNAMNVWYPGKIRERISEISAKYPAGFVDSSGERNDHGGIANMRRDLAEQELNRYLTLQRARLKLRSVILMMKLERKQESLFNLNKSLDESEHEDDMSETEYFKLKRNTRAGALFLTTLQVVKDSKLAEDRRSQMQRIPHARELDALQETIVEGDEECEDSDCESNQDSIGESTDILPYEPKVEGKAAVKENAGVNTDMKKMKSRGIGIKLMFMPMKKKVISSVLTGLRNSSSNGSTTKPGPKVAGVQNRRNTHDATPASSRADEAQALRPTLSDSHVAKLGTPLKPSSLWTENNRDNAMNRETQSETSISQQTRNPDARLIRSHGRHFSYRKSISGHPQSSESLQSDTQTISQELMDEDSSTDEENGENAVVTPAVDSKSLSGMEDNLQTASQIPLDEEADANQLLSVSTTSTPEELHNKIKENLSNLRNTLLSSHDPLVHAAAARKSSGELDNLMSQFKEAEPKPN